MNFLEILMIAIVSICSALGGLAFIILLLNFGRIKDIEAEIKTLKSKKE